MAHSLSSSEVAEDLVSIISSHCVSQLLETSVLENLVFKVSSMHTVQYIHAKHTYKAYKQIHLQNIDNMFHGNFCFYSI